LIGCRVEFEINLVQATDKINRQARSIGSLDQVRISDF